MILFQSYFDYSCFLTVFCRKFYQPLNMKRLKPTSIAAAISAILLFGSGCSKDKPLSQQGGNEQEFLSTATLVHSKNGGAIVGLETRAGHTAKECDGSCNKSQLTHIDCAGSGKQCLIFGSIELERPIKNHILKPQNFNARCLHPEDFSDHETFAMPARSFYIKENNRWINIPQQTLERDTETRCFLIKSITFTEKAIYPNL